MDVIAEIIRLLRIRGFDSWKEGVFIHLLRDGHKSKTPIDNIHGLMYEISIMGVKDVVDILETFHDMGMKIKRGDFD